jgi:hypothetical protein
MILEREFVNRASLILLGASLIFSAACTTLPHHLSSLPKDFPPQTVIVSLDTWHAMLAFPVSSPDASTNDIQEFEEWGFAERAWYVEGKTGIGGISRALFWPTEGVVEVGRHPSIWAERTPQPPAEVFVLHLEPEPYRQLRQFLDSTLVSRTPLARLGGSAFYPSARSYHLFHTCHQYAARALQAAGLPVTPTLAFSRTMLGWQLSSLLQSSDDSFFMSN